MLGADGQYLLRRMEPEITPGEIRRAEFKTTFRGLDRDEVEAFIAEIAGRLERLEAENDKLAAVSEEVVDRDLDQEFETIGREVTSILQAAREAADSMRERAALDAARWRSEAMEETKTNRSQAAADAEAMRRDAWTTGSELLAQAAREAKRMREEADRDVLTIQGEAEREAHRLTSGARREAEDLLRNATMDAEKATSDAAKRRDEIIDQANRQAAAAQERARALERRRDELMEELENVRSTLSRLEGSLEEKKETFELSSEESTTVKVVPTSKPSDDPEHWEPGETVRVVRPGDDEATPVVDIDLPSQELDESPVIEPPPKPRPSVEVLPPSHDEDVLEEVGQKAPEGEVASQSVEEEAAEEDVEAPDEHLADRDGDDVSALFSSLRSGGDAAEGDSERDVEDTDESGGDSTEPDEHPDTSRDWIEVRNSRLLPITNRALRGAKKSLTELQNIALDGLRTDDDWRPSSEVISETLQAELISVWAESFAAGHTVAEEMTGSKIKRPPTPTANSVSELARALAEAVETALDEADDGQRARQAAVSRVFRVWRTDEAERRIRELAIRSYQLGVERSVESGAPVG